MIRLKFLSILDLSCFLCHQSPDDRNTFVIGIVLRWSEKANNSIIECKRVSFVSSKRWYSRYYPVTNLLCTNKNYPQWYRSPSYPMFSLLCLHALSIFFFNYTLRLKSFIHLSLKQKYWTCTKKTYLINFLANN